MQGLEGASNSASENNNLEKITQELDAAAKNFLNAFNTIPYEELTAEQKDLADKIKKYFDSIHPNRTLH